MRYVILTYVGSTDGPAAIDLGDLKQSGSDLGAVLDDLEQSGEYVSGERLVPSPATTVRVREGAVHAVAGSSAEAEPHLAGYVVVECATPARAEEIAAMLLDGHCLAAEVRPVMVDAGLEM